MSFLSPLESFQYKPYIKRGKIQRDQVVLENKVIWYDDEEKQQYIVPTGFVFDLASIPFIVGFALKKLGRHQRAACIHDWFYANQTNGKLWADKQFRLAMDEDSTKGWRKWTVWLGVGLGGWFAWWSKDDIIIVQEVPELDLL